MSYSEDRADSRSTTNVVLILLGIAVIGFIGYFAVWAPMQANQGPSTVIVQPNTPAPAGTPGPAGAAGAQGSQGAAGANGAAGADGAAGAAGADGKTGETGTTGSTSTTGETSGR